MILYEKYFIQEILQESVSMILTAFLYVQHFVEVLKSIQKSFYVAQNVQEIIYCFFK